MRSWFEMLACLALGIGGGDFTPWAALHALPVFSSMHVPSRFFDVEITLGATPTTAAAAVPTFAANLGPSPTLVLSYQNVLLPGVVTPAWVV